MRALAAACRKILKVAKSDSRALVAIKKARARVSKRQLQAASSHLQNEIVMRASGYGRAAHIAAEV